MKKRLSGIGIRCPSIYEGDWERANVDTFFANSSKNLAKYARWPRGKAVGAWVWSQAKNEPKGGVFLEFGNGEGGIRTRAAGYYPLDGLADHLWVFVNPF